MPERKTLNRTYFCRGSSANLPRLHTCENKVPFWDFRQFAVTISIYLSGNDTNNIYVFWKQSSLFKIIIMFLYLLTLLFKSIVELHDQLLNGMQFVQIQDVPFPRPVFLHG